MYTKFNCETLEARQLLSAAYSIVDLSISAAAVGFTSETVAGVDPTGHLIVGEGATGQQANVPIVWTTGRHGTRRVSVLPSDSAAGQDAGSWATVRTGQCACRTT